MNDFNIINHPPTPEELAEIYKQTEENNPQSLFYKRILVRQKLPVGKLLLFLFLFSVVAVTAYLVILHRFHNWLIALAVSLATVVFIGLLMGKSLLITLVKSYQSLAPDKLRNRCRYEPSCSEYMLQAVEKYGFLRGMKKGFKRWRSCKPPNGGFDIP